MLNLGVSSVRKKERRSEDLSDVLFCENCGHRGHSGADCDEERTRHQDKYRSFQKIRRSFADRGRDSPRGQRSRRGRRDPYDKEEWEDEEEELYRRLGRRQHRAAAHGRRRSRRRERSEKGRRDYGRGKKQHYTFYDRLLEGSDESQSYDEEDQVHWYKGRSGGHKRRRGRRNDEEDEFVD